MFIELAKSEQLKVSKAAAVVAALHLEATRIAQLRMGPVDPSEIGTIVVALATVYVALHAQAD